MDLRGDERRIDALFEDREGSIWAVARPRHIELSFPPPIYVRTYSSALVSSPRNANGPVYLLYAYARTRKIRHLALFS